MHYIIAQLQLNVMYIYFVEISMSVRLSACRSTSLMALTPLCKTYVYEIWCAQLWKYYSLCTILFNWWVINPQRFIKSINSIYWSYKEQKKKRYFLFSFHKRSIMKGNASFIVSSSFVCVRDSLRHHRIGSIGLLQFTFAFPLSFVDSVLWLFL